MHERKRYRDRKRRLLNSIGLLSDELGLPTALVRQKVCSGGILRTPDVCRRLGISAWTLRRLVNADILPAAGRFRGRYLFDADAVSFFEEWGPPSMSTGQAARALRRHINTVKGYASKGVLPCQFRHGRRTFQRSDVMDFASIFGRGRVRP
jgi:DNA-binding transcriptional MerR regulator